MLPGTASLAQKPHVLKPNRIPASVARLDLSANADRLLPVIAQ